MGRRASVLAAAMMLALVVASGAAFAASVPNGGFEAGNLGGWKVKNQQGGDGNWFAYGGTTSPESDSTIAAPPAGNFAATSDQSLPGSHVLYRDVKLKPRMRHTLSFQLYYENRAARFVTPNTLSFNAGDNQQYRVDVLKPSAGLFSVRRDDVLAEVFRTEVGDPNTLAPTPTTFDLTPFAGRTVRLRFAEVDNTGNLLASVDDVRVRSESR
jgi:hypothetical protein